MKKIALAVAIQGCAAAVVIAAGAYTGETGLMWGAYTAFVVYGAALLIALLSSVGQAARTIRQIGEAMEEVGKKVGDHMTDKMKADMKEIKGLVDELQKKTKKPHDPTKHPDGDPSHH